MQWETVIGLEVHLQRLGVDRFAQITEQRQPLGCPPIDLLAVHLDAGVLLLVQNERVPAR